MPRFTLLALTDADVASAMALLPAGARVERHGAYMTSVADERTLEALQGKGFLVNAERELPAIESAPEPEDAGPNLLAEAAGGEELAVVGGGPEHQVIQVDGPLTDERLAWLGGKGLTVGRKLGPATYLVSVDTRIWDGAAPAWMSLGHYGMQATLGPVLMRKAATEAFRVAAAGDDAELLSDAAGGEETASRGERFATEATAVAEPVTYDVSCHERSRLAPLYQRLKHDHRVVEVIKGESRLRLTVAAGEDEASLLSDLGRLEAVDAVELYVPPEPLLSFAAEAVVGGAGGGLPALKWRGEGQTIGIADSGIDAEHPDFQGRLTVVVRTPPLSDRDPRGHGTHVASIAAGDGAASGGKLAGLASKAKIFMQSLADENMQLQPGVDLEPLLDEAYQAGVRVQNFSWGSDVASRYTMNSKDVDAFVYDHQDMLIVVAGGNSGIQEVQGDPPRIALKSLAAPANAKNCLTVGASCSPRQDGPYANQTWNHFDGRSPPSLPPMSGLPLTGDPKVVAALSSRGPSDDGRLKPDLLAPGVGIAAARSADSTPNHPLDDSYCFMSGTSMAAPLVAGAAVVVRQYYMDERDHTPSAALLKATLINGADWLEGEVWEDSRIGQPNFHQGFGLFSLGRAIPLTDDGMALLFEDIGNGTPQALRNGKPGESGTSWSRKVTVAAGMPFSVTLAWTDPPPRSLQHELDLVLVAPSGKQHVGNAHLVRLAFQDFDSANNVEQVRLAEPEPGDWKVYVFARNTYRGPQGFGLAMTGALT